MTDMNGDVVVATADLVARAGARVFELGHTGDDDSPAESVTWHASAQYQGARLIAQGHASPAAACLALAERLLTGGICRCRQPVTLSSAQPGCRWRLVGQRWESGCDAPPILMRGAQRGDVAAMRRALRDG
jgi:hypothetical protein